MNLDYSNYKEKTLDLSGKGLTNLDNLILPQSLEELNLAENNISSFDSSNLSKSINLITQ